MYHGDNKSALTSQKLISEALLRLMAEKPFSAVSVSDICREAQVSRQTFYSLFGTKENIMVYELRGNCFIPDEERPACRSASFRSFCKGYSSYIIRSRSILELLVSNDMMHFLHDVQYESFMECRHFLSDVTGSDRVYLVDFIASGMNSIAKNYVLTGCTADEKYLERQMFRLFGGLYFLEGRRNEYGA
ncbi:MAG: helix-turn-helix transcriptional regulator [Ruminococcus sp.]|nr:helix-turn-helix transcriptional regulator [Ruminococcus sp.]